MSQKALITSRDPQGRHIVDLFGDVLDKAGLTPKEADYLIRRGDKFKAEERKLLQRLAIGCPASVETAQQLLGTNFFGVEEWQDAYGVTFTKTQLAKVSEFPWGEATLTAPCPFHPGKKVKDTHFAFLGVEHLDEERKKPLTIRQWQELHPKSGQPRLYSYPPDCWYEKEGFATTPTCQLRWYLCLKEIVPGSENKTFDEQQRMLPVEYEVPSAVEEVTKHVLCFKKTGTCLTPSRYGRVRDVDSHGDRVSVGCFASRGLIVNNSVDGYPSYDLGLASARKLQLAT